jgi:signal transduction histidine kinase
MGQVLVNVFLNAIQAMPEGGILGVRAEVLAEEVHITISDTGKGISKEVLPRVFDPFFTTKGQEKGTGLGLWLSQGIVERHGGTIHLSSDLGKGSVVRIRLPLRSKTKEV